MDKFVTIFTGYNLQEIYQIRNWLETEGIECFLKDELTVQVTQYSNTFGGVKVQVQENEAVRAITILNNYGYTDEHSAPQNVLLTQIEEQTLKIPFIKRFSLLQRLLILTLLTITVLGPIGYYLLKPSDYELLTTQDWCVSGIYYDGHLVGPKTTGFRLRLQIAGMNFCDEQIQLRSNRDIDLPGLNTEGIRGRWIYNEDKSMISIFKTDTLQNIYCGNYDVVVSFNHLTLRSAHTVINATKQ